MQDQPTVGLYLDTRYASKKNGGKFPVKVRVTWEVRKPGKKPAYDPKYFDTSRYLTEAEFELVEMGKAKGELREAQSDIYAARAKASAIIEANKRISILQFTERYNGKIATTGSVKELFLEVIEQKRKLDKISTQAYYVCSMNSLLEFGGEDLDLIDITPEWCKNYELWRVNVKGKSLNTASAALRALRRVCKIGLKNNLLNPENYAFRAEEGFTIRKKRVKKTPAPVGFKDLLFTVKPEREAEAAAIDFTLFSFLCNGMNFADMAHLESTKIFPTYFTFIRRKTKDTVTIQSEVKIEISPKIREILNRRGTHGRFVFGIIDASMDERTRKRKINQWSKTTNKWLNRIAVRNGYENRIVVLTFRHLFTSMILAAGVPITQAANALAHTSITTTQDYAEDLGISSFNDILTGQVTSNP